MVPGLDSFPPLGSVFCSPACCLFACSFQRPLLCLATRLATRFAIRLDLTLALIESDHHEICSWDGTLPATAPRMLHSLSCPATPCSSSGYRIDDENQHKNPNDSGHDVLLAQRPTHRQEPELDLHRPQSRPACSCIQFESRPDGPETQETSRYVRVCCAQGVRRPDAQLHRGIQSRWWGGFYFWQTFRFHRRSRGRQILQGIPGIRAGDQHRRGPVEGQHQGSAGSAGAPRSTVGPAAERAHHRQITRSSNRVKLASRRPRRTPASTAISHPTASGADAVVACVGARGPAWTLRTQRGWTGQTGHTGWTRQTGMARER